MKLKINKTCDLSSLSVLPPQTRRLSGVPSGPQASQHRSQPSQQSGSQGLSSQRGFFSQFSETPIDEVLTNERLNSQERENSAKKTSNLPAITYPREDSQLQISRPSNLVRKWNSTCNSDNKCQINEELERRIGIMESSLSKISILLESLQSDVMQVNRATKEVLLETESIRQKLNAYDHSALSLNKEQEEIKSSIDEGFKSISGQLSKDMNQEKLQEIHLVLSVLPQKIEAYISSLQNELCNKMSKDMNQEKIQDILLGLSALPHKIETFLFNLHNELCNKLLKEIQACKQKTENSSLLAVLSPKKSGDHSISEEKPIPLKDEEPVKVYRRRQHREQGPVEPHKAFMQASNIAKKGTGGSTVKNEHATSARVSKRENKRGADCFKKQGKECRIIIHSDEDSDLGFCCLLDKNRGDQLCGKGDKDYLMEDTTEETKRILQKARMRKRRSQNTIIIN